MSTTEPLIVGPNELHALILNAQMAMWDTVEPGVEFPYCHTELTTKEIYQYFLSCLPATEEGESYRRCASCRDSILQAGDWVIVNADGTLDSVLFPAVEFDMAYMSPWLELLVKMNQFITHTVDDAGLPKEPRIITSLVCRPLDGGLFPKSHRGGQHRHFNAFVTPRDLTSARTQCKRNDRIFKLAELIKTSAGFTGENLAGIYELHGVEVEFSHTTFSAIAQAIDILSVLDEDIGELLPQRENIITLACGYEEGLAYFPTELLDILNRFQETTDYNELVESLVSANL